MTKWIMAVAVVVVVGAGAWWWFMTPHERVATEEAGMATTTESNGMSAPSDNSNQALVQDTAAIDAQMQGLASDSAAADASMSDQPVPQAY